MKKNFIFFLACWLTASFAYGQCTTPLTPPLLEGFGTYPPTCWDEGTGRLGASTVLTIGSSDWEGDDFANVAGTGRESANLNIYGTAIDEWIISPSIDLGTGMTSYQLEFDVALTDWQATGPDVLGPDDTLAVVISTDNGATWSTANILRQWNAGTEPSTAGDHIIISLAAYTGVVKFGFYGASTSFNADMDVFIDNFEIAPLQNCLPPTNLAATNITVNSADLNWMSMAPGVEIEYGPAGFAQGTGTTVATSSSPFNVNMLMGNTDYDFYVRNICAPGDTSNWAGPRTFTTPCAAAAPPYAYPFNDFINNDPCWTEATGRLRPNSNLVFGSSTWLEDGFANIGTQDAARINIYTTRQEWLISQSIDLGVGTPYQLEFDIALTEYNNTAATVFDGDDTVAVVISTDDGLTWSSANVLRMWTAGQEPSNTGDRIIIDLSAYSGTVKFGFYAASSTSAEDNDLFIDNMAVVNLQTCNAPSNPSSSNITATTANVAWLDNNAVSPSGWVIEYGPTGFALGSGTSTATALNPATISMLMPNTSYDFYVRAVCSPGDSSLWSSVGTFTTACAPLVAPYVEQFPTPTLPACWTEGGDNAWEYGSAATTPTGFAFYGAQNVPDHTPGGGGTFIGMDGSDNVNGDVSTLFSPFVDVSGLTNAEVSFWVFSNNTNDNAQNLLLVELYDGAAWNTIHTIQGNNPAWVRYATNLNLAGLTITGPIQLRFTVTGVANGGFTYHNDILIDDVIIENGPTCPRPGQLMASNITGTSADLGWMQMGPALSWEIEYGLAGFTQGTGTVVAAPTNPFNLNMLTPQSDYEFYVRSICAPGDTSSWSSVGAFTTPCAAVIPTYNYPFNDFINNDPCWTEATGRLRPNSNLVFGSSTWLEDGFANIGTQDAARINIYTTRQEWLISRSVDLGTGVPYQLEFDIALTDFADTFATPFDADDTVAVVISTDNGVTWSDANVLRMWTAGQEPSHTGERIIINLSAYSGVVKFGFYAASSTSGTDTDLFIDNMVVQAIPPADLVINEIMYNPPEGGADTTEYIEIYNNGATPVDLTNFSLVGVTYTFPNVTLPAGGYYVVTVNNAAFTNTYGFAADDEWTSGGLNNGGEAILILDNNGMTLDSVRYSDSGLWPASADGNGPSLILCDPNSDNADPTSWEAATTVAATNAAGTYSGSPGSANTCAPTPDVAADQFLLNTNNCGVSTLSGGFVITNLSGVDANAVNYTITSNGTPLAGGVIPVVAANSSDTILVGPVPVFTGSGVLQAIVTVSNDTDNSNDTLTQTIFVSNTDATITQAAAISCSGGNDGSLTATGSNGLGTYTYNWSNSATTATISGLTAGNYIVTVTDSIGCSATDTFTLVDPAGIVLTETITNVSCNGGSDGAIAVVVTGGSAPYTYLWSNNATTPSITGLTAGNYDLTVTDANGCTAVGNYTVTEPTALVISETIINVSCNGGSDGAINTTVTGGTALYTYLWSNGATSADIISLTAGNYDLTVTDANGCTSVGNYTVTEPAALVVNITDNADGTATANATGGTGAVTYLWDDPNSQTTQTATGLVNANNYIVIATDANGCTATDTITIRIISVSTIDDASSVSIFPNPASDQVFIDLDLSAEQPVQIELYNAVGQRVLAKAIGNTQATRVELSTANLPTGVYQVHLMIGTEHMTQKLIVRKP